MCAKISSLAFYLVIFLGSLQSAVLIVSQYGYSKHTILCGSSSNVLKDSIYKIETEEIVDTRQNGVTKLQLQSQKSGGLRAQDFATLGTQSSEANIKSKSMLQRATSNQTSVFDGIEARAFESWPQKQFLPCYKPENDWKNSQNLPLDKGLIYLKGFKTGSSTSSGIHLRIARNVARRQKKDFSICQSRFDHTYASVLYGNRTREKTFLWSILRHPTSRVVSQFFHFFVSRDKKEPTDQNFVNYVTNGPVQIIQDYYLRALSLTRYDPNSDDPVLIANKIIEDYNFIGVTERMDESALALAMLMGVPISDILYLTAKGNGGFDDGGGRSDQVCTYIWPSFISEGMQTFLDSEEWIKRQRWDLVLYQAANRSLDLTIDRLGREKFDQNLLIFKKALELSRSKCLSRTTFPCSTGGKFTRSKDTDCLWTDAGCGSECLDEVSDVLDLWSRY